MTLTVAPDPAANAYADEARVTALLAGVLGSSAWGTATSADREAAILMATRRLDAEAWRGEKAHTTAENPRRWPRRDVYDPDGLLLDDEVVPEFIEQATAELALFYVEQAASSGSATPLSEITVGPIRLKYAEGESSVSDDIPDSVYELIAPYRDSTATLRLVRV